MPVYGLVTDIEHKLFFMHQVDMETALDIADSKLDDQERAFLCDIREHGWFNHRIFDDGGELPDFSYSTGFYSSLSFPEIIVFSLSKETSHQVLWDLYRDIKSGKRPLIGTRTNDIFGNQDAILLPVSKSQYREHLGWSRWFYRGDDFPCLQLVWPDEEGKFSWESAFNERFADDQPDLTEGGWSSR